MNDKKRTIDNALAGIIIAFDPETGDALHVHEMYVETIDGEPAYSAAITDAECEEVRREAVERYPRRRIDVIIAPTEEFVTKRPQLVGPQSPRYHVDPMTRKVRVEPEPELHLLQEKLREMSRSRLKGR
jgi:hypothetical protein